MYAELQLFPLHLKKNYLEDAMLSLVVSLYITSNNNKIIVLHKTLTVV